MQQLGFYFPEDDKTRLKYVVKRAIVKIRKLYPKPVNNETQEEYQLFLRDEILLEISEQLKDIALHKQKENIDILYKGIQYTSIKNKDTSN